MKSKYDNLYLILCLVFITNAILAEIIGVKIFSLENYIGLPPTQIHLPFNFILDFNLTAGVVIWPIVFITSDIINEYYGKKGLKFISYTTAILILYSFGIIYFSTTLPPATFWIEINKTTSGNFNINSAFSLIFRQGLGIITGSLIAFLIGQLVDTYTFHYLKKLTGSKNLWIRATGSTIVSQLIDSFIVLGIAFYVFGNWSLRQVIAVGFINYLYKFFVAVMVTPLIYLIHNLIDKYLEDNKKNLT